MSKTNLLELGQNAVEAKYELQRLSTEEKNHALQKAARLLVEKQDEIIEANAMDLENGEKNGMHPGMLDRLRLTSERIQAMAEGLVQIAELPDCIGEVMEGFERPNGLAIEKVRVPLGVIGIIYESRPNVTADAFGLCFKTGNAVILKGGSDAIHSNIAVVKVLKKALSACGIRPTVPRCSSNSPLRRNPPQNRRSCLLLPKLLRRHRLPRQPHPGRRTSSAP